MFSSGRTYLKYDKEAIKQNIDLLLLSDRGALLGDPYYGSALKRLIYEQNSAILRDILIDEIYVDLKTFIPQIIITRDDITIKIEKNIVYAVIKCIYKLDGTSDLFELALMSET